MIQLPADAWFAVQVAPRSEKRVATMLEYKGYKQFAPMYVAHKKWSDRIKKIEDPLFPGYVFVRLSGGIVGGLLCSTPGVTRILSSGGRPVPIPDHEVEAVRQLTRSGKPVPTHHLTVGQKVEIQDGPFCGVIGIVRHVKSRMCLIVSVQLISQSISVDVDGFHLRPIVPIIGRKQLVCEKPRKESGTVSIVQTSG